MKNCREIKTAQRNSNYLTLFTLQSTPSTEVRRELSQRCHVEAECASGRQHSLGDSDISPMVIRTSLKFSVLVVQDLEAPGVAAKLPHWLESPLSIIKVSGPLLYRHQNISGIKLLLPFHHYSHLRETQRVSAAGFGGLFFFSLVKITQ